MTSKTPRLSTLAHIRIAGDSFTNHAIVQLLKNSPESAMYHYMQYGVPNTVAKRSNWQRTHR